MKFNAFLITILLIAGVGFSCSSGGSKKIESDKLPEAGLVHRKIGCKADTSISYALYVPVNQLRSGLSDQKPAGREPESGNNLHPCIIAFDPHGDGLLPVSLYHELAEKYGYILFGSNNSKNGLPHQYIDSIVSTLFHEAKNHYPVDTNRIYLMGFSGGARIATLSGLYKIPVKGVISCGAGLAGAGAAPNYKIDYYGMAGMADFNMNEIIELDYPLSQAGLRHVITTFDGIHAWPPKEIMEGAFQWFLLNAMKDGVVQKDDALIANIMTEFGHNIANMKSNARFSDAANSCNSAISFGNGLVSTEKFSEQLQTIEKLPEYQAQIKYRKMIMADEEKERKLLMEALTDKDLLWWKSYADRWPKNLSQETKDKNDWKKQEMVFKDLRLQAFLRLLAYMNANSVLTSKNEEAAWKIVSIYELVDPDNPEPYYMKAMIHARKSENKEAFSQINLAINKGFSEKLRMSEQPEFATMKESPEFFDLLQKIK